MKTKKELRKASYDKNGASTRKARISYYQMQKAVALDHYGNECECCGDGDPDILTIDHIDGNGAAHRKTIPASQICSWLIRNNFPPGFRVLCFNCNWRSRRALERTGLPLQTIRNLQREVVQWADSVYPDRTIQNTLDKFKEELAELRKSGGGDPMEWADVIILMLDACHLQGIDLQNAVRKKVAINYERSWLIDPKTGKMSHRRSA